MTPTITLTLTVTLTPTHTLSPTVTLSPTITLSPTTTPTFADTPLPLKTVIPVSDSYSVALSAGATIFITQDIVYPPADQVESLTTSGNSVTTWSAYGSVGFSYPFYVAVSPLNSYVYVTNGSDVYEFSQAGVTVGFWSASGSEIAIASNGNVYLSNSNTEEITEYTSAGTLVTQWSANTPGYLAVSPVSPYNVYVVEDTNTPMIQEFSSSGSPVTTWGGSGTGFGQFGSDPEGIAVSSSGLVFVSDPDNGLIQEFNLTGKFVSQWVESASDPDGEGARPVSASSGDLYVSGFPEWDKGIWPLNTLF